MSTSTPDAGKAKKLHNLEWKAGEDACNGTIVVSVKPEVVDDESDIQIVSLVQDHDTVYMSTDQARQTAHNLMAAANTVEASNEKA